MDPDGRPIRGYGLIQPTMHDCGMNDATGTRVFIPHNTWAVYADKIALDVARLLEKTQDIGELEAIYQAGRQDLLAAIDRGAIQEGGYRWIPSSPNDPSGSFWGGSIRPILAACWASTTRLSRGRSPRWSLSRAKGA